METLDEKENLSLIETSELEKRLTDAKINKSHLTDAIPMYGVGQSKDYEIVGSRIKNAEIGKGNNVSFVEVLLKSGEKLSLSSMLGYKPIYSNVDAAKAAVRQSRANEDTGKHTIVLAGTQAMSLGFSTNYLECLPKLIGKVHIEVVDGYKLSEFGLPAESDKEVDDARNKVVPCKYYNVTKVA